MNKPWMIALEWIGGALLAALIWLALLYVLIALFVEGTFAFWEWT